MNIAKKIGITYEKIFEDLLLYQKSIIALPSQREKVFDLVYDWHEYFENIFNHSYLIPEKRKTTLKIEESSTKDWVSYAHKRVWYGKRYENTINIAELVE